METSLDSVINTLEESLVNNTKKLEHFNSYKRQIELHLSETQSTIDECEEEITSAKRLLRIFNQK
jgi:flagellar basal body rod protein FlgF